MRNFASDSNLSRAKQGEKIKNSAADKALGERAATAFFRSAQRTALDLTRNSERIPRSLLQCNLQL